MYLDIEVEDSIFDPDSDPGLPDRTARWRNPESQKPLYRVFLYLDGRDLPYVSDVVYLLHPTFKDRTREVFRTPENPRCKLTLWTWGLFRVEVIVRDKQGNQFNFSHYLQYDREFANTKFIAA